MGGRNCFGGELVVSGGGRVKKELTLKDFIFGVWFGWRIYLVERCWFCLG